MVEPSVLVVPKGIRDSAWAESVDLLSALGLDLDDWQELIMQVALGERMDRKWAALFGGWSGYWQYIKSQMLVARAVMKVSLFGERKVVLSAHQHDQAGEKLCKYMDLIVV